MASLEPCTRLPARNPVSAHVRLAQLCSKSTPALYASRGRKSNVLSPGSARAIPVTIPPTVLAPSLKSFCARTTP